MLPKGVVGAVVAAVVPAVPKEAVAVVSGADGGVGGACCSEVASNCWSCGGWAACWAGAGVDWVTRVG